MDTGWSGVAGCVLGTEALTASRLTQHLLSAERYAGRLGHAGEQGRAKASGPAELTVQCGERMKSKNKLIAFTMRKVQGRG